MSAQTFTMAGGPYDGEQFTFTAPFPAAMVFPDPAGGEVRYERAPWCGDGKFYRVEPADLDTVAPAAVLGE